MVLGMNSNVRGRDLPCDGEGWAPRVGERVNNKSSISATVNLHGLADLLLGFKGFAPPIPRYWRRFLSFSSFFLFLTGIFYHCFRERRTSPPLGETTPSQRKLGEWFLRNFLELSYNPLVRVSVVRKKGNSARILSLPEERKTVSSGVFAVFEWKGWRKEEKSREIRGCLALEKLTGLSDSTRVEGRTGV